MSGRTSVRSVMETHLDRILEHHRARYRDDKRVLNQLLDEVTDTARPRGFTAALAASLGLGVIAEIKRRSPSKGELHPNLDPADLAKAYERGGATCLSVLTDDVHFGGSTADLIAAREAGGLPVLRKDFTVGPLDVVDARLMGADAVLLIVAALGQSELSDLHDLAKSVGLDALVEIHDESELERALAVGATLIGVNQRDLVTFEVDQQRAVRLAPQIPSGIVRVAESGVRGVRDAASLAEAGFDAVLVGESIVTSSDKEAAVRKLRLM